MRFRFFLVIALFLFFLNSVHAAVPTVDFNWTPFPNPNAFSDTNFDPLVTNNSPNQFKLMYWKFGIDGNVNLDTGFSDFNEDFSDGDLTDPLWVFETPGNWSIVSGRLEVAGPADENGHTNIGISLVDRNWHFSWNRKIADAADSNTYFLAQDLGTTGDPQNAMYVATTDFGNTIKLYKIVNGVQTELLDMGNFIDQAVFDINITYHDSNWQVWVDDSPIGSFIDTSIKSGSHIALKLGFNVNNVSWDDFNFMETSVVDGDLNQVHVFTSSGQQQICLTSGNEDGNATKCVDDLNIHGAIRLTFNDENTLEQFAPSTVTVNGTAQDLDGNALFFSLSGISTLTDFTVLASDANKTERTWFFNDLNQNDSVDRNVSMLDSNLGAEIKFTFFDTDQTTLLPNAIIEVIRNDVNRFTAEIKQASSTAKVSFFLNKDADYIFQIDSDADGDIDSNYAPTIVTVKIPKNEDSLDNITPFRVRVTNLRGLDLNNLTTDSDFNILANTDEYYRVFVSEATNGTTFERGYLVRVKGNPASFILQPYLVSDSELSSTINVKSVPEEVPLQNIVIKSRADIQEVLTLVESHQSDGSGNALFSFIVGRDYQLEFDRNDSVESVIFITVINATATTYFVNLFLGDTNFQTPEGFFLDSNQLQRELVFDPISGTFDLNAVVFTNLDVITEIVWTVKDGDNILHTETRKTGLGLINDFNAAIAVTDHNAATIITSQFLVTFVLDGVSFTRTIDPQSTFENPNIDSLVQSAQKLNASLGDFAVLIIAIVVALISHGFAANMFSTTDYRGLVVLYSAILWGFVFLGFVDAVAMFFASIFGFSALTREKGGF